MTKRRDLERELRRAGWVKVREGGSHSIFERDGVKVAVPRHAEIKDRMAEIIRRQAGI